ncbi:transporter [Acinetobacter baumannii]|nr:transporter [Acinetobacter baumannii]
MVRKYLKTVALTTSLLGCASFAMAAENGGSAYPDGTESFFGGAMPPPGTYLVSYNQFYSADKFKNDHPVFDDFKLDTFATVARGIYVSDKTFLGASWGMHAFLVYANADITLGGNQDETRSMGDVIIDPFLLGWHKGDFHVATGVDFYIPVGSYNKNRLSNIGRNYYTIQPIVSPRLTTLQPFMLAHSRMYLPLAYRKFNYSVTTVPVQCA